MYKSISLLIVSLFFCLSSFGQFNEAGSKCLTFGFNSLVNLSLTPSAGQGGLLLFKYYPKEDFAFRFLGSLGISNTSSQQDNGSGTKITTTYNSSSFGVGLGFQKTIAKFDKFCAYAGADLIGNYSYSKNNNRTDNYKTTTNADSGDYKEIINAYIGPYKVGIYPLVGIGYFFSKNFSIGLEYSMALFYTLPATGTITTNQRYFGADKSPIVNNSTSTGTLNFSTNGNALINIGFYF